MDGRTKGESDGKETNAAKSYKERRVMVLHEGTRHSKEEKTIMTQTHNNDTDPNFSYAHIQARKTH